MCGRMACNLCREDYRSACSYLDQTSGVYTKPEWIDLKNGGYSFHPSNNICPSDVTPVLISGSHLSDKSSKRCLTPMLWGLIPRWHKGDPKKHGLSTSNCRIEGVRNLDSKGCSKLYARPLREGKRCVIICEGYYEWQTTKGMKNKQPYYIYMKQENNCKVEDTLSWKNIVWNEQNGWEGPALLKMAAVYDVWTNNSGEDIYNYSIITVEPNESMSWLHNRMPAILSTALMVQDWLDTEHISSSNAIKALTSASNLSWHPVSTVVNNSRNKDPNCNKSLRTINSTFSPMKNWLQTGTLKKRPVESTFSEVQECKQLKK